MIAPIEELIDQLDKNEKVINYLKAAYQEKTGEPIIIPDHTEHLKHSNDEEEGRLDTIPNQRFQYFKDKVNSLNLPSPTDKEAKARIEKLKRLKDTKILISKLDISYFAEKEITLELMKRVSDGWGLWKSVTVLNLSHNNLGDNYITIICSFFLIPNLNSIDLSYNNLGKSSAKPLCNTIKATKKLLFLDLSYNPFNTDEVCCLTICAAMRQCENLIHFGICDSSRDNAIRLWTSHPNMKSLNWEDSRYKKKTWDLFTRYLSNRKFELSVLSLKFCKIDFIYAAASLAKGISKNKKLISLNLYGTGMCDTSGMLIINAAANHPSLLELDLGGNHLRTRFCKAFGELLKSNKVLKKVNIAKNEYIVNDNYKYIIEGLVENQTLLSLGDLIDSRIGVKFKECSEHLFQWNKQFKDWREAENLKLQKVEYFMSSLGFEMVKEEREEKKQQQIEATREIPPEPIHAGNSISQPLGESKQKVTVMKKAGTKNNNNISTSKTNSRYERNKNKSKEDTPKPKPAPSSVVVAKKVVEKHSPNPVIQKALKNKLSYSRDINQIIESVSPSRKKYDTFISYNSGTNSNRDLDSYPNTGEGTMSQPKIVIPFSTPGTNYVKESQNIKPKIAQKPKEKSNSQSKSKNRRVTSSTSRGKSGKKVVPQSIPKGPNIMNIVASYTQEVANENPEVFISMDNYKTEPRNINTNSIQYSYNAQLSNTKNEDDEDDNQAYDIHYEPNEIDDVLKKYGINDWERPNSVNIIPKNYQSGINTSSNNPGRKAVSQPQNTNTSVNIQNTIRSSTTSLPNVGIPVTPWPNYPSNEYEEGEIFNNYINY